MKFTVTFKNNKDKKSDGSEFFVEPMEHKPAGYKLIDGKIVPCFDMDDFCNWYENSMDSRRVAFTKIIKHCCSVSTVFLGIDHSYGAGPVLFETLVFGVGKMDGWMWRYSTLEEAKAGHQKVVNAVKNGDDLEKLDI